MTDCLFDALTSYVLMSDALMTFVSWYMLMTTSLSYESAVPSPVLMTSVPSDELMPLRVMMKSVWSHVMKTSAPSGEWTSSVQLHVMMTSVSSHGLKASTLSYV